MIGRKRSRHASWIASAGDSPRCALRLQREIDQHDAVLLDDAHQQDDRDHTHDVERLAGDQQREQRAEPGRGQGGEDGQRMQQALVQHAEHDVDRDQRGRDQHRLRCRRLLQPFGVAGELGAHLGRHAQRRRRLRDRLLGIAERHAGGEIEAQRRGRELALVAHRQRRVAALEARHRRKRNLRAVARADIDPVQHHRRGLQRRIGLHHHLILVALRNRWSRPGAARRRCSAHCRSRSR